MHTPPDSILMHESSGIDICNFIHFLKGACPSITFHADMIRIFQSRLSETVAKRFMNQFHFSPLT